jgi:hypothetical protein
VQFFFVWLRFSPVALSFYVPISEKLKKKSDNREQLEGNFGVSSLTFLWRTLADEAEEEKK